MIDFGCGENELDYRLYILSELAYAKEHPGIDEDHLFPDWWYIACGYHRRIDIIAEALEKGITVQETEGFQKLMEGVRD